MQEKDLKTAGQIAREALSKGSQLIRVGASMLEVLDALEQHIKDRGGSIAFPAQISLNDIAAHYCPTKTTDIIFKEGDLAKLDLGVHINGQIADTALTVDLGNNDSLVQASKEALEQALAIIRPGIALGEIGRTIQETIESYGFRPVHNLSGHGLGPYQIHTKPNIPNVDTKDPTPLKEGQTIAIEPFATSGAGEIFESSHPTIFSLVHQRPVRSALTRDVLKTITTYRGLPFTTRWLESVHGSGKTSFALRELLANGSLQAHPPLPDKNKGSVSQHEHSVLVRDKPLIYTKE